MFSGPQNKALSKQVGLEDTAGFDVIPKRRSLLTVTATPTPLPHTFGYRSGPSDQTPTKEKKRQQEARKGKGENRKEQHYHHRIEYLPPTNGLKRQNSSCLHPTRYLWATSLACETVRFPSKPTCQNHRYSCRWPLTNRVNPVFGALLLRHDTLQEPSFSERSRSADNFVHSLDQQDDLVGPFCFPRETLSVD